MPKDGKVKRDFLNQGKKGESSHIFFEIFGVAEAFCQQKTENGKGNPANTAENQGQPI